MHDILKVSLSIEIYNLNFIDLDILKVKFDW